MNSNPQSQLPKADEPQALAKPMPLVSIVIRSMDRTSLPDALASVEQQTYPSIEIVLVNAKGFGHGDTARSCGRFPIRFIDSSIQLNRSAAANTGLDQAQGTYVVFLDDDDLIDADHVESLVDTLTLSADCKAAYSGTRVVDASGTSLGVYDHAFSATQLLVGNFLPIHAVLFSRDLVAAGCRFDTGLETYEDWDFWLQISRQTCFAPTGKVTAVYRSFLGNSGMSSAEDRPIQRQRRSIVWQKWWPHWNVEVLNNLAVGLEKALEKTLEEKGKENSDLGAALGIQIDRNGQITKQNIRLADEIAALHVALNEQFQHVRQRSKTIAELQGDVLQREAVISNLSAQIDILHASIQEVQASSSWKLTAPVRRISAWFGIARRSVRAAALLAQKEPSTSIRTDDAPPSTIKGLEPRSVATPEPRDYQPLSSIDIDKYAYFFIDVFDTAIVRLFERPVDIFKYIETTTHSIDFETKRIAQEHATRNRHSARKDIRLMDIYEHFEGADPQLEIATELKFCIKHPEVFSFYTELVSKGKKVYFVSDMYLARDTLAEILKKNGYDKYEDIFVSSEDDFIKGDGSRFSWLKAALPASLHSAIHIGDNHNSDWVQPIKYGYDAFHYRQSIEFFDYDAFLFSKSRHLIDSNSIGISFILGMFKYWKSSCLDRQPGYWRQFGFLYGGALVSAFCGFLNRNIQDAKLSTSRIFFLARDGEIMSKVYKLLYSEYEAVYLLASRRCMGFPSLSTLESADDTETLKLFTTPIGIVNADGLMDRFGYDDFHELRSAFNELESDGLLQNESAIQQCIVDHKASILSKARAERDTLLQYLESMRFFEDSDIVIADVGWGGSIQNALVKLLHLSGNADKQLHGLYLGVGDRVAHEDYKSGFLFQGDKTGFAEFLNLIELITSSPQDGVVRLKHANGEYRAIGPQKNADEINRQSIAAEIQTGILDFAQILKDRGIENLDFLKPSDFRVLFGSLQTHPSEEDIHQLGGVKHAMTLGNHFAEQVLTRKGH